MANQRRDFNFPRPTRGPDDVVKQGLAENLRALEAWIAATQDLTIQDGEKVVYLDANGDDEWYWMLGSSDDLELYDAGDNLRAVFFATGGFHLNDSSGVTALQYDDANNRFSFRPTAAAEFARIEDAGLLTDHSEATVPLSLRNTPGSATITTASTWETLGTEIIAADTANGYSMEAEGAVGFRNTASTTLRNARARLRYSTDGGSTWTNGQNFRVDGLASNGMARASVPVSAGFENTTPTGDIHVELQVFASHNEVAVDNSTFGVVLVGTF